MANILITGAAGFIGSQLMHAFSIQGECVVGIDNFSFGYKDNLVFDDLDLQDSVITMDIRETKALEELFKEHEFDYVYHCAAITTLPDCQANVPQAMDINVRGTAILLEFARNYRIEKFVFASTSAVYENETYFPCPEKLDVQPTIVYSVSKAMGESLCRSFADCYDLNTTIMRFANVYGPRMDCLRAQPPVVAYLIRELHYNRIPILHGSGEQKRDFIYSEDLVELALKIRTTTGFDMVNVSSNTAYSINDIFAEVAKTMGKPDVRPDYAEPKHLWEQFPTLFSPVPIKTEIIKHEIDKLTLCDNTYAQLTYGWEPHTSLSDGIAQCVDYTVRKLDGLL